ncbi:MAG: hypothetical protein L0Z55_04985, partial [Planctomycetes bacterium]|nr:hypothetical protein [Planctomycetota bacterium]
MSRAKRAPGKPERLLIAPPFADPTQPYLSLPVLKGHLRAQGLDARVIDLNVEAAHYLFERATIEDLARRFAARYGELNRAKRLTFEEQIEYRAFAAVCGEVEALLDADPRPLDAFRDEACFYDPVRYARARRHADVLFGVVSALSFPFQFDFNRAAHAVLPWSFAGIAAYAVEEKSPLAAFYRRVFRPAVEADAEDGAAWVLGDGAQDERAEAMLEVDLAAVDFIGISIVFPSQIPEAFALCRLLAQRAPGAFIAIGGPCIHQAAVHMDEARRLRLLDFVDGVGLYEGEETLVALFRRLPEIAAAGSGAERSRLLGEVPNLLFLDGASGETRLGPPHTVDLRQASAPDYDDLPLDRYLAPSRTLLYAPTRGCYWNRCSFCYYGLSESATAKYREVPPERAAADLARLARRHGVRNFYISCDVLSPSYALRFAEAIVARGLKIHWSSDLKIDKYFTPER